MQKYTFDQRPNLAYSIAKKAFVTLCLLVASLVLLSKVKADQSVAQTIPAERISLHEAKILIYLLPHARELRNQAMDIGWELQTNPKLNQEDFYTFWVVNSMRPDVQGSVTIGYFSVNKHTADLWDDDNEKLVSTAEIEGIKKILRKAHHIEGSALQKFSSLRPNF